MPLFGFRTSGAAGRSSGTMPRYYFHLYHRFVSTEDEDGQVLADDDAVLAAAGFNFHLLLRWLAELLRALFRALLYRPTELAPA